MRALAFSLVAASILLPACAADAIGRSGAGSERAPIGKADQIGSCQTPDDNFCGGQSDGNCWCDDQCELYGDCCADKPVACDGEEPEFCSAGDVVTTTEFSASNDGLECATEVAHCVTSNSGACPQFSPLPPDFCEEGEIVQGNDSFITSIDGMECQIPSVHCVTTDHGACPQFSPPGPDFCTGGEVYSGPASFIPSADGMECEIPSLHCVTNDANACEEVEPEFCAEGEIVTETIFVEGGDSFECQEEELHCLTNDFGGCSQFVPLPFDFCSEGEIVQGPASYIAAADGMECELPSVHCITPDHGACPQLAPLPPDFCEGGDVVVGDSSFIPSADGMECEMPSVHCVMECE